MSQRDEVFNELLLSQVENCKLFNQWEQKWRAAVRADNLAEYQRRLDGRPHAEAELIRQRPSVHEIAMCLMAIIKMPHYYSDVGEWAKYIYKCAQSLYDAGTAWEEHDQKNRQEENNNANTEEN